VLTEKIVLCADNIKDLTENCKMFGLTFSNNFQEGSYNSCWEAMGNSARCWVSRCPTADDVAEQDGFTEKLYRVRKGARMKNQNNKNQNYKDKR